MPDFNGLEAEYEKLWNTMEVKPDKASAVDSIAQKLIAHKETYEAVEDDTGVPWPVIAAWHMRESSANFKTQLAQGDPLNNVSVHVPAGRGPFSTWEEGAYDALVNLKHLDEITDWSPARICYETERYNGFGYRNKGRPSPYLWSFSNHYTSGKYVADGVYDANAVDKQCGAIPIIKRIMELEGIGDDDVSAPEPARRSLWDVLLDLFAKLFSSPARPEPEPGDLASRIVAAMKKRGFRLDTGPGEFNTVYVEGMSPEGVKNDNAPNQFNDARFVLTFDGKWKIAGCWQATTEPSLHWTKTPMNAKGAARIKFGQYTAWKVGVHNGNHEALVQTGGKVTVCRDLNKDFKRDGDREETDYFGINQHWGYDLPKDDLGTSSAGCLVGRMRKGHQEFMALMKSDVRYVEDHDFVFTAAVIPASEV